MSKPEHERDWVSEAIAEQEEHVKRVTSCRGIVGTPHAYRDFGNPETRESYRACVVCGVREHNERGKRP